MGFGQTVGHRARVAVWLALLVVCVLVARPGLAAGDRGSVSSLARTLERDPDEKARLSAAVSLGRLADRRGVPALIRALSDKSALVRGVAASALGHIGDKRAIPGLEKALGDNSPSVRQRARRALAKLRQTGDQKVDPTHRRVKPKERPRLGPKTDGPFAAVSLHRMVVAAPRTPRSLGDDMERYVRTALQATPEVTLSYDDDGVPRFVLDGSIVDLSREWRGPWVETRCEVKLTISTPEGKMVSIVTGAATVQTPRGRYHSRMQKKIALEALENAVKGAHQNLVLFFARQLASK